MLKTFLKTTVFVVLFFIPQVVFGGVVINEVLYDATGTDTGKEYIILYNNGGSAAELAGYELNAVSGDYYIFPSFSLAPNSRVIIHWRLEGTDSQTDLYTGTDGFDANIGDTSGWIALFKGNEHDKNTIIDYIEYGAGGKTWENAATDAGIWITDNFITDVEAGKSIKLKSDGQDNNSISDWTESLPTINTSPEGDSEQKTKEQGGGASNNNPPSPEAGSDVIAFVGQKIKFDATNSTDPENDELHYEWNLGNGELIEKPIFDYEYPYPGTYVATLMIYDGRNYATDAITVKIQPIQITISEFMPDSQEKDEEAEWIEIYNYSESIANISGWKLDDEDGESAPFTFSKNTFIAPKSFSVFPHQVTKITLNNDKDSVRLLLPEGAVFEEVKYEKPPQGKSSARIENEFIWSEPTPGTTNIYLAINKDSEKIVYLGAIKSETTKNPPQASALQYFIPEKNQSNQLPEISQKNSQDYFQKELATVRQTASDSVSDNLVYILIIIILSGALIGIILAGLRKNKNEFLKT